MTTTTEDATTALDGGTHETTLEQIKPTAITAHPKNPRKHLGDIAELADSIKGAGVLEPLIVTPAKAKGKFTLIAGHRRHAAAKKAGLKSVPCLVRFDLEGDDRAQLEIMLTENLHRSDLNAVEEGTAYQTLLEFDDVDVKSLAARTGHKQATIRSRVKLAQAPHALQEKLVAKQITIEDALALLEFSDDQSVYNRLALHLGSPNFAFNLQRERENRAWAKKEAKLTKELTAKGIRVVFADNDLWEEEEASDGAFEWFEKDENEAIPEGAELAAVTNSAADEGYTLYYKRIAGTEETGAPIPSPAPEPKTETPEQIAARADRERRDAVAADLRTAATVRRKHLASVAAEHDEDLALKCLRFQVLRAATVHSPRYTAAIHALLGLPPLPTDADENDHAEIERHVNKMSLEQLAVSVWLLEHLPEELNLEAALQWEKPYHRLTAWQTDLTVLFGYEWSDVEQQLLDARLPSDKE